MTLLFPLALALQEADGGSGLGWISWIVIGILAGWIAEQVMKTNMGLLMNFALGIVGALVGGFLAHSVLGLGDGGFIWNLLIATAGAMLVLWIASMIRKRSAVAR